MPGVFAESRGTGGRGARLPPAVLARRGPQFLAARWACRRGHGSCRGWAISAIGAMPRRPPRWRRAGSRHSRRGQYGKPGPEGRHITVAGPCAFREDQHHFAPLQAAERLFDAGQPQTVAIDGYRVQRVDQPAQRREAKERLPGQVVHSPPHARSNQRRVEVALVIGNDQHRPRFGYILSAAVADAVGQNASQIDHPAQDLIPKTIWQGTRGHAGRGWIG